MRIKINEIDQFDQLIHDDSTKFESVTVFDRNGLAPVSKNNLFGLINGEGDVIIPFEYQSIVMSTINAYSVSKDDKWGFVTKSNQIIIPIIYDLTSDFIENLCAVKKDNKWGFIDLLNTEIIPFDYDGCTDFRAGIAGVVKNDKWGVIDKENNLKIDFQYEYLTPVDHQYLTFGKATTIKIERPDILAYFPYFLSKDNYLMNFGLVSIENNIILEAVSELPVLESYDGKPVVRQNYQQGYLNDNKEFVPFEQFEIDPYEEKILKQIGVMK